MARPPSAPGQRRPQGPRYSGQVRREVWRGGVSAGLLSCRVQAGAPAARAYGPLPASEAHGVSGHPRRVGAQCPGADRHDQQGPGARGCRRQRGGDRAVGDHAQPGA